MQVLISWVLIISFQLLILHDIKQNLIIDFTKSDLELKLFLIDSQGSTCFVEVLS